MKQNFSDREALIHDVTSALGSGEMQYPNGGARWSICATNAHPNIASYALALASVARDAEKYGFLSSIFSGSEISATQGWVEGVANITRACIRLGLSSVAQGAIGRIASQEVRMEIDAVLRREASIAPRPAPHQSTGLVSAASGASSPQTPPRGLQGPPAKRTKP